MLFEKLVDHTNRKAMDHINKNSLSDLKTAPSVFLLKVRMAVCGQIQTLSSQDMQFQSGNTSLISTTGNPADSPSQAAWQRSAPQVFWV